MYTMYFPVFLVDATWFLSSSIFHTDKQEYVCVNVYDTAWLSSSLKEDSKVYIILKQWSLIRGPQKI